jgi:hypothetical protein
MLRSSAEATEKRHIALRAKRSHDLKGIITTYLEAETSPRVDGWVVRILNQGSTGSRVGNFYRHADFLAACEALGIPEDWCEEIIETTDRLTHRLDVLTTVILHMDTIVNRTAPLREFHSASMMMHRSKREISEDPEKVEWIFHNLGHTNLPWSETPSPEVHHGTNKQWFIDLRVRDEVKKEMARAKDVDVAVTQSRIDQNVLRRKAKPA